jgi:hypothetical protein
VLECGRRLASDQIVQKREGRGGRRLRRRRRIRRRRRRRQTHQPQWYYANTGRAIERASDAAAAAAAAATRASPSSCWVLSSSSSVVFQLERGARPTYVGTAAVSMRRLCLLHILCATENSSGRPRERSVVFWHPAKREEHPNSPEFAPMRCICAPRSHSIIAPAEALYFVHNALGSFSDYYCVL